MQPKWTWCRCRRPHFDLYMLSLWLCTMQAAALPLQQWPGHPGCCCCPRPINHCRWPSIHVAAVSSKFRNAVLKPTFFPVMTPIDILVPLKSFVILALYNCKIKILLLLILLLLDPAHVLHLSRPWATIPCPTHDYIYIYIYHEIVQ